MNSSAPPNIGDDLLLLLHAAATGPASLGGLAGALERPGRRIAAPDLCGGRRDNDHGAPGDDIIEHSVGVARAALNKARDESRGARRFVFGHSMGGLVALLMALEADRDGDAIDALILYEPILHDLLDPAIASDAEALVWDRAIVSEVAADVSRGNPEAGVSRFVAAWNETAWTALPSEVRRQLVAGAGTLVRQTGSMLTRKLPPQRLAGLRTPTLLLGGDRSPAFTGLVLQRAVGSIPKSRCVILEGAGHMAPLNAADRVAGAIRAWLEEQALD